MEKIYLVLLLLGIWGSMNAQSHFNESGYAYQVLVNGGIDPNVSYKLRYDRNLSISSLSKPVNIYGSFQTSQFS
ncbi:MAG: hypothetical protein AAFY41_17545 [Bacteroidota bacterium]